MKIKNFAILNDITKCIGCEECVKACQKVNNLPKEKPWRWTNKITDLSSSRWTTIEKINSPKKMHYIKKQCRHCLEPACVEACIVGALKKTEEGPVIYDKDICIGCRYCMMVCPWEIPRYSWEDVVPYIQKCGMCYERVIKEGKIPACVEACPEKATIFGERNELLAEAKKIIVSNSKYINKVYGEKEIGGTSVLYISDIELNLTDLSQPINDHHSVPARTFKVLRHMPSVFVGMAVTMGGVHWIIQRRQKLMSEESTKMDNQESSDKSSEDNTIDKK